MDPRMTGAPAVPAPNPNQRLFALWVVVGCVMALTSVVGGCRCSTVPHADRTFRFVVADARMQAEMEARYALYDAWEARLTWLAMGALAYAALGLILFRRRGSVVAVVAGAVVAVCGFVLMDATWVPL